MKELLEVVFSVGPTPRLYTQKQNPAHSLTRGQVCNLLFLLVLPNAVPLASSLFNERMGLFFVSLLIMTKD
jgi:hypothetical protein